MNFRFHCLLITGLVAGSSMAQVDTTGTRPVPDTYEPAVIDVPGTQEPDSNSVLIMVDETPAFPGGMPGLYAYLKENVRYPKKARKKSVEGKVLVSFVVEKDGRVSNVRVLHGIGSGCDEEALRVVQQMPAWTPGQQSGKPVRVRYTLPLRFKLLGEK